MRTLSQEAAGRMMDFEKSSYRPQEIIDLEEQIKMKVREARKDAMRNRVINKKYIKEITNMNSHLDNLYMDWAEGKIS